MLKAEEIKEHIYDLPYEEDKHVFIAQGYNGIWSHRGEYSLDFRLRKGKLVLAARDGVVIEVVDKFEKGGPFKKYISQGNYVIVKHDDGTYSSYWHFMHQGVFVKAGQRVSRNQPIGKSGSTGYSSMAHLHFTVYYYNEKGIYTTMPTKFYTSRGIKQLKALGLYKRPIK